MKKRERTAAALLAALCLTATACGGQPGPEEAVTTAAEDLSAYAGCWKYDDMPFYMVINEDNEWVAINVYGDQVGPGAYTHEGDGIILSMDSQGDMIILKSKMPVAQMFGFSGAIRSATEGRALWSSEFAGFEPLPANLLLDTVKQIRTRKGLKPEMPKPSDYLKVV